VTAAAPRRPPGRDLAVLLVGWSAGFWLLARLPRPRTMGTAPRPDLPGGAATPGPGLSVVVPARDEEHSVGALLASLAAQTTPATQIIVVDDQSGDDTAGVAGRAGATVMAGSAPPAGWTGKAWACHQGAGMATGELLVFLDADVTLAPEALAHLVDEHRRAGGLVSVEPFHRTERWYERLSAVCNIVTVMGTGAFTGPPWRPTPMAFGPCLVLSRLDYDRIGGHAHPDVRGRIAEDVALARRALASGRPVRLLAGRDVVAFRMYPGGPRQLVQGWTKMLGLGVGRARPEVTVLVSLWITAALIAARGGLGVAGRRIRLLPPVPTGVEMTAVGVYGAFALQTWWMLRRLGRFGRATPALFPVPLGAFVALFLRSVVLTVARRPVRWRGRGVIDRTLADASASGGGRVWACTMVSRWVARVMAT
jgi:4,4'-diaponeurosporenoate glycosyltransferase